MAVSAHFSRVRATLRAWRRFAAREAPWLCFALFALLVSWEYTSPAPPRTHTARPEAHGDGAYYYAYYRSLVFDHDLELKNDYRLLGDQFHAGVDPVTGRARNVFPPGAALFWLPFAPVAHLGQDVAEALGAPVDELRGDESLYQRSVLYGSVVAGLVTCMLMLWIGRRITSDGLATLSAVGVSVASPLLWYMLRQPSFSHAVDSCVAAMFASAWLATFGSRSRARWLVIGGLLGLAMLVRPQNVAHVLLPLGEWLYFSVPLVRARAWAELRGRIFAGICFVVAVGLGIAPLLLMWRGMYGTWTLVPQGGDFMYWFDSRWDAALFASRNGLFAFHPLLLLATVGLGLLALSRRYPRELRMLALFGVMVLAVQAYINGSALDWWAGWAHGGRRFLSCTIYFGAGLAALLDALRVWVLRHTQGFVQLVAGAVLLGFALHNRSLIDDNLQGRMPPDQPQPFKPRYAATLDKTLEELYPYTGNPGSWPASLWFALRAGTSPERFDLAAANDFLNADLLHGRPFGFDDWHAFRGFGPAGEHAGRAARKVVGREATWLFMLRSRNDLVGEVQLASSHPGATVTMYLNGVRILRTSPTAEWQGHALKIPRDATSTGANYVQVVQKLPKKPGAFVAYGHALLRMDFPQLAAPAAQAP